MGKLTAKQLTFCDEYLIDLNATKAAERAGYSPKTARSQGQRLLTNVDIQKYIQAQRNKTSETLEISRERVAKEYAKIAFSDIRKIYDDKGNLRSIKDLEDDIAGALSSLETFEEKDLEGDISGYTKKVRMYDKKAALDSICKMFGFNVADKLDITSDGESIKEKKLTPEQARAYLKALNDEL